MSDETRAAVLVRSAEDVERLVEALRRIAGPSPRSQRPEVEQLRDAVKWRQGIARDALVVWGRE
jgi:hypothetical protein